MATSPAKPPLFLFSAAHGALEVHFLTLEHHFQAADVAYADVTPWAVPVNGVDLFSADVTEPAHTGGLQGYLGAFFSVTTHSDVAVTNKRRTMFENSGIA